MLQRIIFVLSVLFCATYSEAATFICSDVPCLVAAIHSSNWNGQDNVIFLEPGIYTLQAVDNTIDGPNGLPSIKGRINIRDIVDQGATIQRDPGAPNFRLFHVDSGGVLTLFGLTLRGGRDQSHFGGGAISNRGTLRVDEVNIVDNTKTTGSEHGITGAAGINNLGGDVSIMRSNISDNAVTEVSLFSGLGGGIHNSAFAGLGGTMEIVESLIHGNRSVHLGGGVFNAGDLKVTASAIYRNAAAGTPGGSGEGGGIYNTGKAALVNTTVALNQNGGVTASDPGTITALNVTLTGNTGRDLEVHLNSVAQLENSIVGNCFSGEAIGGGRLDSKGHNIVRDGAGCNGFRLSDLIDVDPRLADFDSDNGAFDLLADSPAINATKKKNCPATDQLGRPRKGKCDIGAIEFQGKKVK